MRVKFKYNGREYYPKHLDKKLKELGITIDDIEIITKSEKKKEIIEYEDKKLYYFINPKTKETILSIYPTLEGLGKYGEGFLPTKTVKEFSKAFDEVMKQVEIEHPEWINPEQHIICSEYWKELIEKRILEELKEYERNFEENTKTYWNQARQV